jgi:hypothetical protein
VQTGLYGARGARDLCPGGARYLSPPAADLALQSHTELKPGSEKQNVTPYFSMVSPTFLLETLAAGY